MNFFSILFFLFQERDYSSLLPNYDEAIAQSMKQPPPPSYQAAMLNTSAIIGDDGLVVGGAAVAGATGVNAVETVIGGGVNEDGGTNVPFTVNIVRNIPQQQSQLLDEAEGTQSVVVVSPSPSYTSVVDDDNEQQLPKSHQNSLPNTLNSNLKELTTESKDIWVWIDRDDVDVIAAIKRNKNYGLET